MGATTNPLLQPQLTEPQKRKAAIYCRVASTNQLDAGEIDIQLAKLRDFAKQQGFSNYNEYLDNGYRGNNLNRPSFSKMKTDIDLGEIDTVIVSCISRIARDVFLVEEWISYAKARGIRLIALNNFHEQPLFVDGLIKFMLSKRNVLK